MTYNEARYRGIWQDFPLWYRIWSRVYWAGRWIRCRLTGKDRIEDITEWLERKESA